MAVSLTVIKQAQRFLGIKKKNLLEGTSLNFKQKKHEGSWKNYYQNVSVDSSQKG